MTITEYLDQKFANYPATADFTELKDALNDELNTFINQEKLHGKDDQTAFQEALEKIQDLDELLAALNEQQPNYTKFFTNYRNIYNKINELSLVNTKHLDLTGIDEVHFNYRLGKIILLPSPTDQIIINEYMSRPLPSLFSVEKKIGNVLNVDQGPRRIVGIFRERIEILIPDHFKGFVTLHNNANNLSINNLQTDYILDLTVKSGNIKIAHLKAKRFQLDLHSGNLQIRQLTSENIHLNADSGNLELTQLQTSGANQLLTLTTKSGSVHLTETTTANLNITTQSGNLRLANLQADHYQLKTNSGSIRGEGLQGSGTVLLKNGNLNLDQVALTGDLAAEAKSGNLKIAFLPATACYFKLTTNNGNLKLPTDARVTDFQNDSLQGQIGHFPENTLTAQTTSGNIKITN